MTHKLLKVSKLYLIGGNDDGNGKNDVYSSSDGAMWTQITDAAAFSGRSHHQVVVFQEKLYLRAEAMVSIILIRMTYTVHLMG